MNDFELIGREEGTDKVSGHRYQEIYPRYIEYMRPAFFTLFEVGIYKGASLRLWRRYFPLATIHGFDNGHKAPVPYVEGCSSHQVDVTSDDFEPLARSLGTPAVVIDDGGHWEEQQRSAFDVLWPLLTPGGWYFIEDMQAARLISRREKGDDYTATIAKRVRHVLRGESESIAEIHIHPEICVLKKAK